MVSKIKQCMNILKHIPDPCSMDVVRVSETVGCSERHAWEALRRIRVEISESSEMISLLKNLTSDLLFYQWFVNTNCLLKVEMKVVWSRRIKSIFQKLESLRLEFRMTEKGSEIKEDE